MSKPQLQATRYSDVVASVVCPRGELISIHYHLHTGRVVARAETGAPGGYHSGILLGADKYGRYWIAHHHVLTGRPVIVPVEDFCEQAELKFDLRNVKFGALEVAARAVYQVTESRDWCNFSYDSEDFVTLCIDTPRTAIAADAGETRLVLGLLSAFLRVIE